MNTVPCSLPSTMSKIERHWYPLATTVGTPLDIAYLKHSQMNIYTRPTRMSRSLCCDKLILQALLNAQVLSTLLSHNRHLQLPVLSVWMMEARTTRASGAAGSAVYAPSASESSTAEGERAESTESSTETAAQRAAQTAQRAAKRAAAQRANSTHF